MHAAVLLLAAVPLAAQSPSYQLARKIPVGGKGGWDYTTIDGGRLYRSHGNMLVVVDLATEAVVGTIANTNEIHSGR